MPSIAPFVGEVDGPIVYTIGTIGTDTGDDGGGVFTGTLRTERASPMGEGGWGLFRRVSMRVLKSGSCTFKMRVYVDDAQTQIYDANSNLVDQEVTFTSAASALKEELFEFSLSQYGTHFSVEIELDSDDTTGVFLVESITVQLRPMRETQSRDADSS